MSIIDFIQISLFKEVSDYSFGYTIPISINFISGKEISHHLKTGIGVTYLLGLNQVEAVNANKEF